MRKSHEQSNPFAASAVMSVEPKTKAVIVFRLLGRIIRAARARRVATGRPAMTSLCWFRYAVGRLCQMGVSLIMLLSAGIVILGGFVWDSANHDAMTSHGTRKAATKTRIPVLSLFMLSLAERRESGFGAPATVSWIHLVRHHIFSAQARRANSSTSTVAFHSTSLCSPQRRTCGAM